MLTLEQIRCPQCNRRLVDLNGQAQIRCPKCKSLVEIDTEARKIYIHTQSVKKNANYSEIPNGWRFYFTQRELSDKRKFKVERTTIKTQNLCGREALNRKENFL